MGNKLKKKQKGAPQLDFLLENYPKCRKNGHSHKKNSIE